MGTIIFIGNYLSKKKINKYIWLAIQKGYIYMSITIKKGSQHTDHGNAVISKYVKGYENDLYFVKKQKKQ